MSAPTARGAAPTGPVPTAPAPSDPFAEQRAAQGSGSCTRSIRSRSSPHRCRSWRRSCSPRGFAIPLAFIVLVMALLLVGARLTRAGTLALVLGTPVAVLVFGVTFGVWVDPSRIDEASAAASVVLMQVGEWQFTLAAYLVGLATSLRLAALLHALAHRGPHLDRTRVVRAMVQNLRVPYRIGYTALAALRFVPRFGHELEVIRAAHRVRGTDTRRGPDRRGAARHRLLDPAAGERDPPRRACRAGHGCPRIRSA